MTLVSVSLQAHFHHFNGHTIAKVNLLNHEGLKEYPWKLPPYHYVYYYKPFANTYKPLYINKIIMLSYISVSVFPT
jgi:hypothetical protein